jgi:hypothetical protein
MAKMFLAGFIAFTLFYQAEPFFQMSFTWIYWGMMEGLAGATLLARRRPLFAPDRREDRLRPAGAEP